MKNTKSKTTKGNKINSQREKTTALTVQSWADRVWNDLQMLGAVNGEESVNARGAWKRISYI